MVEHEVAKPTTNFNSYDKMEKKIISTWNYIPAVDCNDKTTNLVSSKIRRYTTLLQDIILFK